MFYRVSFRHPSLKDNTYGFVVKRPLFTLFGVVFGDSQLLLKAETLTV